MNTTEQAIAAPNEDEHSAALAECDIDILQYQGKAAKVSKALMI